MLNIVHRFRSRCAGDEAGRGAVQTNRGAVGAWEKFHVQSVGPNTIALRTHHGTFCSRLMFRVTVLLRLAISSVYQGA